MCIRDRLTTPQELRERYPRSEKASATVEKGRQEITDILDHKDHRLLVVVGPCSIHDIDLAKEYANRLLSLRNELASSLNIVMRVYFEKPRTTVGWKGFINDPYLDDSFKIDEGLARSRELLLHLAEMGMPTGTEALDPISPQYLSDLFSWAAIGARTTESHRRTVKWPVDFRWQSALKTARMAALMLPSTPCARHHHHIDSWVLTSTVTHRSFIHAAMNMVM